MPDLLAGSTVRAADFPPAVADAETGNFTTTSVSYASSGTGTYVDCAVVFTAPTSGRVKISLSARVLNSTTSGTLVSAETRLGDIIGSGTVVEAAADAHAVVGFGTNLHRLGVTHMLDGLTPGAVYNTRLLHKVNAASTGTINQRELIVEPLS